MSETPDQGDYQPGHQPPMSPAAGDESGSPYWGEQPAGPAGFGQPDPSGQPPPFGQPDPYGQRAGFGQQAAYGQGSPYGQPWGAPAPPADLSEASPAPVLMSVAPAQKQNRLTVGFRLIMAIPAGFVLCFVLIAAYVVAFIGWWAALFTGQLPSWAFEFLTGTVRWTARVEAYGYLLTDRYPPFSLDDDPDYPVRLVSRPTRLNRAAVFFRVILVIPAGIVATVATVGLLILSFFGWLIALFTGQLPDSLHQAFTAILRFYIRFFGYWVMITPEYPAGLYGDRVTAAAAAAPAWPADAAAVDTAPGDTAPITGAGGPPAPATASPWQLTLSGSARNLITIGLVLGVIGYGGESYYASQTVGNAVNTGNRIVANNNVTYDYKALGSVLSTFQAKTEACQQNLACVTKLDGQVSHAFATFGHNIAGADVPSDFGGDVTVLTAANGKVQGDFNQLATAQSVSQYTSIASGLNLQSDLDTWQTAYNKLHSELNKP